MQRTHNMATRWVGIMQHGRKEKEEKPIKVRSFIGTAEAEQEQERRKAATVEIAVPKQSSLPPKSNNRERVCV